MSTSATANRIYARGFLAPEDLDSMGPDEVLVRGCTPPTKTEGGIWTPEAGATGEATQAATVPVRTAVLFEIVKLPTPELMTRGNPQNLKVGDVVLARNVLVDPQFGNVLGITNLYTIAGVAERAA